MKEKAHCSDLLASVLPIDGPITGRRTEVNTSIEIAQGNSGL
jgi:hypothetical protein